MRLLTNDEFEVQFPMAWVYLRSYEEDLRRREDNAFNDDKWYRFGRSQNIDKQHLAKLVVPRLVHTLRVCLDSDGQTTLDNVDVGGIIPAPATEACFGQLMAILNGPVANFVFRAISKPFQNDYRSANRQFIAPLPIPRATPEQQADVAARARSLQDLWTRRRMLLREVGDRLQALGRAKNRLQWLWPDVPTREQVDAEAPRQLRTYVDERRDWTNERLASLEKAKIAALDAHLRRGEPPVIRFERGALTLAFGDAEPAVTVYLDEPEGRLTEAYWAYLFTARARWDAKALAGDLRRPPVGPDTPAARQFVERVAGLAGVEREIALEEAAMNEILYNLYRLTDDERRLVEKRLQPRAAIVE